VRSLGTPTTIAEILRNNLTADARAELAAVQVPTLVMHRAEYGLIPASHGRYLAGHVPGAGYVELPGADGPMFWEAADQILGCIRSFIGRNGAATESQFATILFSDIVESTELAKALGDRAWSALIGVHRTIADDAVEGHRGRLVKSTGDGILAVFPDPASAIEGAAELRAKAQAMGITVRMGLHSGRIEVADDQDVSGVAVHIAARVMAAADDGEIVVSRTVRDLMLGAGTTFEELGPHVLKGVDGEWELFALESIDG
jgi:class 3 adenylate cyclase